MSLKSALQCVLTAMVLMGLMAAGASAQVYRGSLSGRVTDPTGAVIPGAKVAIKNNATNIVTAVGTSAQGEYTAPNLLPGTYTVTATASGFQTLVQNNIIINTGVPFDLDLKLTVGSQSQEVSVSTTPLLVTDSASQTTILNQQLTTTLPLSGDNIYLLARTVSGTIGGDIGALANRPFDNGGEDSFSFNGAPGGAGNNAYLIDGMPNNNNEGMGFVPAPDSVSEVSVMTNQYDAEYGRTGGGTVSLALKGGSNQYHGDAYWDLRNNHFDGNLFQTNLVGQKSAVTQWSVPGFQIGGPVRIPGLYNGHDKTFFSVSYQHFYDSIPQNSSRTVPSASQAVGNFCPGAPGNMGFGTMIFDPTQTNTDPTSPNYGTRPEINPGGCAALGEATNPNSPGSVIPDNRIDPLSKSLLAQIAAPNVPNSGPGGGVCTNSLAPGCSSNYASAYKRGDHYYSATVRVDQTLSPSESFFASYNVGNRVEFIGNPGATASNLGYYPTSSTWRINHGAGFNLTSILSPTTVSTFALSWLRNDGLGLGSANGISATAAGFAANLPTLFGANNFPGFIDLSQGGRNLAKLGDFWTVQETLSVVKGAHNLKFGGLTTINTLNNYSTPQIPTPGYSAGFTANSPGIPGTPKVTPNTGSNFASALLGYPTGFSFTNPLDQSYLTSYYSGFVQDNWRVNNKLTLTLGMRWDTQTPAVERYNRQIVGFNPAAVAVGAGANPCQPGSGCAANGLNGLGGIYIGGLQFASPVKRNANNTYYSNWAPRFGFAYQLGPNRVLKGGWGRFVDYAATTPGGFGLSSYFPSAPGYQQSTSIVSSPDGLTPTLVNPATSPTAGLATGGYGSALPGGLNQPTNSTLGAGTALGNNITYIDPNWHPDYTDQFNLAIETRLPSDIALDIAYNGSRTYDMPVNINYNQITEAQYLTLGAGLNSQKPNPFCNVTPDPTNGCPVGDFMYPGTNLGKSTLSVQQLALPYPQFGSVTEADVPSQRSWYNSLQITMNKRMTHGLSFNSNFTYAKEISENKQVNPYDPSSTYLRSPTGQLWNAHLAAAWALPWKGGSNGFVQAVAGGWNVSVIETLFSGGYMGTPGGTIWTGVNPMTPVGAFTHQSTSPGTLAFNPCVANATDPTTGAPALIKGSFLTTSSVTAGCPAGTPMSKVPWQLAPNTFVNDQPNQILAMRQPMAPPNTDMTVFKAFPVGEHRAFQIQVEAYNLFNTPEFGGGSTNSSSNSFALIARSQNNDPRTLQFTGRFTF